MNIQSITERSMITPQGEEVILFLLQPTNVSVLSREGLRARVNALMNVLKGFAEVELLCLNSRESFEHNKQYLTRRIEQEPVPQIRALLEQDLRHLDEIQSRTATAREFMLVIRPRNIGEREMYPYLSRLEKMIREQRFVVRRADREDIKRILAVYFAGDVISESYDDFDGQRWLMKDGRSDYKSASVMDEEQVLQTFLDLIAPAAVRFEVDRYLLGNTWRCVWAVRGYPTSTEEQAILQRLGERAGVTLRIYTRLVSPAEERKILQAADKANRFKSGSTDIRDIVEAQSNLEDVASMIRSAQRNREPFFHTAVYIELIARSEQEFTELRDSVETELGRAKISVDRLHLCQQEGFLSVMPSGYNALGEEFERMLPASSVANLFPFSLPELAGSSSEREEQRLLENRMIYGLYPEVVTEPGDAKRTLMTLTNNYLYKDLFAYKGIKKPELIQKLVRALALQLGSEVSYNELSNLLGVDKSTVESYINLLEKCFVVFKIDSFSRNLRNEIKKGKKIKCSACKYEVPTEE